MAATLLTAAIVSAGIATGTAATVLGSVAALAIGVGISLISSVFNKPSQPKPSDGQVSINASAAPRFRSYGVVKVAGNLMFANTSGGAYVRVFAFGSGEISSVTEHWIDDNRVTLGGSGEVLESFVDGGYRAYINYAHGDDLGQRYTFVEDTFPGVWTSDHLGKGIPSAALVLFQVKQEHMADLFPRAGDTQYRQVQRGAAVPNVVAGVITLPGTWSDHAARIILDYLTHPDGLRLSFDWIQNAVASWETAIADCASLVDLADGTTEARWRIWNTYQFDERPADVLARYLAACDAVIYPTPNRGLAIQVGKWVPPTVTLGDDAIIGFSDFGRGRDILNTANTIRAQFMDPSEDGDYLETDAQIWADDADVAARGEYATDLDFFSVPSHGQCRRLMKLAYYRANPNWVGTIITNMLGLTALGERFIHVIISELDVDEYCEVLSSRFLFAEGSIVIGIEMQLQSINPAAYDWDADAEEGTPPGGLRRADGRSVPAIVPSRTLPVLAGFTASSAGTYAVLMWDAFADDVLTAEVEYRIPSEANWSAWPVAADAHAARVGPLLVGYNYEFRGRTRSSTTGRVGPWTASQFALIGTYSWIKLGDGVAASVDLDFQNDLYFQRSASAYVPDATTMAAIVTLTRASAAYADTVAGVWSSFAVNAPRRTDKGLLIEEARTNSIRNNSMQGAVAGTPGTTPTSWNLVIGTTGLTQTIVAVGPTAGVDCIDIRIAGTAAATSSYAIYPEFSTNQVAAANGQQWTMSWFAALLAGSFANITGLVPQIVEWSAGGANLGSVNGTATLPTAAFVRQQTTITLIRATTAFIRPVLILQFNAGAVLDFTLRFGWPQLELGSGATSPIRTTSAAVTRAADHASLTTFPTPGASYSLYGCGTALGNAISTQALIGYSDAGASNRFTLRREAAAATAAISAGGSTAMITGPSWPINTSRRLAAAYSAGNQALAVDGAAAISGASALVPAGLTTAPIGETATGVNQFNGYIERVALWPTHRITNAGLQTLTA